MKALRKTQGFIFIVVNYLRAGVGQRYNFEETRYLKLFIGRILPRRPQARVVLALQNIPPPSAALPASFFFINLRDDNLSKSENLGD